MINAWYDLSLKDDKKITFFTLRKTYYNKTFTEIHVIKVTQVTSGVCHHINDMNEIYIGTLSKEIGQNALRKPSRDLLGIISSEWSLHQKL